MITTWQNERRAARCSTTERPLTRSLDQREEGLAMQATRVCSVTDCDRPHYGRELCKMHYQRFARTDGTEVQPERPSICLVADCGGQPFGHGWCQKHYARWRNTGDPLGIRRTPAANQPCAIEGCDRTARSRGWCKMHHHRWMRTGNPLTVRPIGYTPPGPTHPSWQGDNITYLRAHRRLDRIKGRASIHACIDCGGPAAEWSYDHKDPDQKIGTGLSPYAYSVKPEHYQPRCIRCHRAFDKAAQ
jgi:hypothetical protein